MFGQIAIYQTLIIRAFAQVLAQVLVLALALALAVLAQNFLARQQKLLSIIASKMSAPAANPK
jgi:ABC-type methionine transport system permease subunit